MFKHHSHVFCTFQYEALHNWENCDIEEVSFLKYPHRHIFHFKAYKEVNHGDRDIEFIVLKRKMIAYMEETYPDRNLGSQSCEMIADELIKKFNLSCIEVSEDLENGCIVFPTSD